MAQITYQRFIRDSFRTSIILLIIFIFTAIKFFTKDFSLYFGVYSLASLICLIVNAYFGVKATKMKHFPELRMNWFEREILKTILITILGVGTMYLFFVDGLYGVYMLFKYFSWGTLLVRIVVIVMGYKLATSVANIQDALKWLSFNTWE